MVAGRATTDMRCWPGYLLLDFVLFDIVPWAFDTIGRCSLLEHRWKKVRNLFLPSLLSLLGCLLQRQRCWGQSLTVSIFTHACISRMIQTFQRCNLCICGATRKGFARIGCWWYILDRTFVGHYIEEILDYSCDFHFGIFNYPISCGLFNHVKDSFCVVINVRLACKNDQVFRQWSRRVLCERLNKKALEDYD